VLYGISIEFIITTRLIWLNKTYLGEAHGQVHIKKAVPLQAMEALRERGDIAPTHS
jgi:hypothetical protein